MSLLKRAAAVAGTLGLGLSALLGGAPAHAADPTTIDLFVITDLHGYLQQKTNKEGAITTIGAPVMACEIDRHRATNPNTAFVSVGDNFGASAWVSGAAADNPTIDALNKMELAAAAPGNHEFDNGWRDFASRLAGGPALDFAGNVVDETSYVAPEFPYLAANIDGMNPELPATEILEFDGKKVALVGAITEAMPALVNADAIDGVTFSNPAESVNAQAKLIQEQNLADVVVAMIHEDAADMAALMSSDVDVIFGGHSHATVADTATGRDGQTIPVLQPGNYGQLLGHASIQIDEAGNVTTSLRNLAGSDMSAECLNAPDAEIQSLVDAAAAHADEQGKVAVAQVGGSFLLGQFMKDGQPIENRGTESTIANMVADAAQHWGATLANPDSLPVVGVANSGGVRGSLIPDAEGNVTYESARTIQPFAGTKGFNDMTGASVYRLLEQQWQAADAARPMLKLALSSNLRYTFTPEGKIIDVWIDGERVEDNDSKTYRFIGDAYVLKGGDGFTAFQPENYTDSGMVDLDVFIAYMKEMSDAGTPVAPDYITRAVGIEMPAEIKAGEPVEVRVSGLSMSNPTDEKPTQLTVRIGEQIVGTAPITFDDTVGADGKSPANMGQLGEATVTITVPATLESGVVQFEFSTDLSEPDFVATHEALLVGTEDASKDPGKQPGKEPAVKPGLPKTGC